MDFWIRGIDDEISSELQKKRLCFYVLGVERSAKPVPEFLENERIRDFKH